MFNTRLVNTVRLHPRDLQYKKLIQKGLHDSYGIKCKIEDLESIAGPVELRKIISNLRPENYRVGEDFRANFHIHTDASDGKMSVKDMLDSCMQWVGELRKRKIKKDPLPLFSSAITDHDNISNSKKAIAMIANEPDKYKDFKFMSGCEFLLHSPENNTCFEAVGLGFNPFNKKLDRLMKGFFSDNKVSDIKDIKSAGGILSWAHPLISPEKVNDSFVKFLKNAGIDGAEANYQYASCDKDFIKALSGVLEELLNKFKMLKTGGTDSHGVNIFCGPF